MQGGVRGAISSSVCSSLSRARSRTNHSTHNHSHQRYRKWRWIPSSLITTPLAVFQPTTSLVFGELDMRVRRLSASSWRGTSKKIPAACNIARKPGQVFLPPLLLGDALLASSLGSGSSEVSVPEECTSMRVPKGIISLASFSTRFRRHKLV